MEIIRIKDLLLRTQVGFNKHELGKKQDLLLNVAIYYSTEGEEESDNPSQALDYRTICKKIVHMVESTHFALLEKVANDVANLILEMERVEKVNIEVDKPHALRFARSVSFTCSKSKNIGRETTGFDESV
ncbi:D-erythro-7,8-dihydroneopterin triphosphate epimerase [Saccharicrinis carchari]|uniref:Dihydroneopterin triphosphate 2'-epimerase n=1 Tax=Saccharicrinis carchari TaxID=1168039 RepID=A0A521BWL6_SACCC|nr:FolB domain-containing protein [Saccharicrinis carchari]SMO51558.1 D-erythro-7,8-dihydroneopterin triphosphate epimerase [Saccharicrinis carchari]